MKALKDDGVSGVVERPEITALLNKDTTPWKTLETADVALFMSSFLPLFTEQEASYDSEVAELDSQGISL